MFKLIIGKSSSRMFQKAVHTALFLGGTIEGDKIIVVVNEDMKAYQKLFPLFRLNVLSWKNTRAYCDGKKVNPYRFMLKMDQQRQTFYAQVLEQIDDGHLFDETEPFLYYKREGNRFYFQGIDTRFHLDFKDRVLFDFVDKYNVGDIVYFE
ncbi:hypothetical protein [Changchengzhania lutea]|uniref:hypothetical protein n=1 Tax=Changchengzhania lutea TaxID=2049305 RepID=UPI00115E393D|nr:hypothetical protein [Changchengzhania lutea]